MIRYRINDAGLRIYARDLERMKNWRKPLKEIGQVVGVQGTRKRFDEEKDPDGKPWKRLAAATVLGSYRGKTRTKRGRMTARFTKFLGGRRILRMSGMRGGLMRSITAKVDGKSVVWGTNKIYGRIHQLGGEAGRRNARVKIPARPYLGLSKEDERTIGRIVVRHLRRPGE